MADDNPNQANLDFHLDSDDASSEEDFDPIQTLTKQLLMNQAVNMIKLRKMKPKFLLAKIRIIY